MAGEGVRADGGGVRLQRAHCVADVLARRLAALQTANQIFFNPSNIFMNLSKHYNSSPNGLLEFELSHVRVSNVI